MHKALPPTSNALSTTQRTRLLSSTRKLQGALGAAPQVQVEQRAKRLPIGPTPKPAPCDAQTQRRTRREGVIFSHASCSSLSSWQSLNYTSSDLYPNLTPSPSSSSYPTKPVNHPSNEPVFHFGPKVSQGPIHISLPGYPAPAKGRARPNLTIKVPSNDISRPAVVISPAMNKSKPLIPISPVTPTPTSPLMFAYPVPHVAIHTHQQKRKKMDKLRRHLGENIPTELVFSNAHFTTSPETPRRPPIPRFVSSSKQAKEDAASNGWNMLKAGASNVFKPGPFASKPCDSIAPIPFPCTETPQSSINSRKSRPRNNGTVGRVDHDIPSAWRPSSEEQWELLDSDEESSGSSDYHTAPEVPGARMKSWQGMWNVDDIDQVRAALRTLKAR